MKDPERAADGWAPASVAALALAVTTWLVLSGVRTVREGGIYYFALAHNLALGLGSTFDGVHVTNGYHPLWVFSLAPVFWLSREPGTALALGTALQGILLAASAVFAYRTTRQVASSRAALLAACLWLALAYREALSGLEFALHAVLVLATADFFGRRFGDGSEPGAKDHAVLGLLLGLTFLARLDTLLLGAIVGLCLALREARRGIGGTAAIRLMAFAAPLALAVSAYAVASLELCGHVVPVTAAVKWEWSLFKLRQDPFFRTGGLWLAKAHQLAWPLLNLPGRYPVSLAVGGFAAPALLLAGARGLRRFAPFVVYALLQVLVSAAVYHGEFSFIGAPSYYVVQPWLTALLASRAVEKFAAPRVQPRLAGTALVVAACAAAAFTLASVGHWRRREALGLSMRPDYDCAAWVRANLPEDAVIASWRTAAVGYLSGRRVIELSGLMNSWHFWEVERKDLCAYWDDNQVAYLLDLFENRRAPVDEPVESFYASCADRMELVWSDGRYARPWRMEAYRIRPR